MEILTYFITKPIILLFEIIFMIFGRIYGTEVVVLLVSIIANILFVPLFIVSDSRVNESFKKTSNPIECIRSVSYPVLYFFIHISIWAATFSFFNNINIIHGTVLGPITDLSSPDGLIHIGPASMNLLTCVFFILSVASVFINRKKTIFHKIISVVLYVLLSVFLYFSPSGSNLFWITYACISILIQLLNLYLSGPNNKFKQINSEKKPDAKQKINTLKSRKPDIFLFLTGIAYLIILTGIFIPSNIMKVSTAEFVDVLDVKNPLHFLLYSTAYAVGTFGIWISLFYYLAKNIIKVLIDRLIWIVCVIAFINLILAGTYLGETSPGLFYFEYREFDFIRILIDYALCIGAGILVYILIEKKKDFMKILIIAELGIALISTTGNCIKINGVYRNLNHLNTEKETEDIISLNKNGQNVIVLITDRALGSEVPYIFAEKPELKEQFDGFTFYPNTYSFGGYTNTGIPAVYGGYEYTPAKINDRANETLEEKHNEALRVMPVLFAQNDFNVTVCDPAYAGYNWIPDLSIYDEYPGIKAYNTDGKFDYSAPEDYTGPKELLKRNFFVHSLMKIAPFNWQFLLYNESHYCNPNYNISLNTTSIFQSEGYNSDFLDAYLVLTNLNRLTSVNEENNRNFLLFYNGTPHMPCLLQEPDYTPARIVDNREYHQNDSERFNLNGKILPMETTSQATSYCVNMATYIQLGKWFDYLRENGCYDNTRIILVSDHGRNVHVLDKIGESDVVVEYFMPVLMVKDFNATGLNTSEDIMTNADVASLAVDGLIDNPANPFSGNPLDGHEKNVNGMTVFYSDKCNLEDNHGNVFVPGKWFEVHDNPHILNNWSYLGEK